MGYRNIQKDFETVFYSNNAYKELLLREDAGILLQKRYELVDPISRERMFHPLALELLFSQPNFLQQLTANEKKKLVARAFEKNELRVASGIFNKLCEPPTLMLIARTMLDAKYAPFAANVEDSEVLKRFIDTSMSFAQTKEELVALKQLIIDSGKDFISKK